MPLDSSILTSAACGATAAYCVVSHVAPLHAAVFTGVARSVYLLCQGDRFRDCCAVENKVKYCMVEALSILAGVLVVSLIAHPLSIPAVGAITAASIGVSCLANKITVMLFNRCYCGAFI